MRKILRAHDKHTIELNGNSFPWIESFILDVGTSTECSRRSDNSRTPLRHEAERRVCVRSINNMITYCRAGAFAMCFPIVWMCAQLNVYVSVVEQMSYACYVTLPRRAESERETEREMSECNGGINSLNISCDSQCSEIVS